MATTEQQVTLRMNAELFRNSLAATILAILGCLSTHILALIGVTAAVAWLRAIEHALVVAVIGGAALTLYAVSRNRRCRHTRPAS